MGRTPDRAEAFEISCILTGGKQYLRTIATIDIGSSSKPMNEDFARTHGLPRYPMHTPETIFAIDGRPAGTLTHDTVAYVDIGGHRSRVLFHLMKTKPQLEIISGAGWLLRHGATLNFK
jgi:hypothetical protein